MNKHILVKQRLLLGLTFFSTLTLLHAATQPAFTFIPTTPTTVTIPVNGNAVVQYRVTNQTKISRTLTMEPIAGVTQLTGSDGECAHSFMLASKQSCLLTLKLNGNQLPEHVTQGPVVCKNQNTDDNSSDPFLCYQPSQIDSLNISRLGVEQAALSVTPSTQTLIACGASRDFTVTNHSTTVTATNILANLTGTALVGNVAQNYSDCTSVGPSQSCTLTFTPECISAVTLDSFPIQGDNTQQVGASIDVVLNGEAPISVTGGSPLNLQGTNGTPVTGTLTVTNNSSLLTATHITADITGVLATAGVTLDATHCATVLPGESCTLTFTPGSQAVSTTSVIVRGSNTSQTTAAIAVNAAPQVDIEITAGTPLALSGSTGTMTIRNNSATERAINVVPNFAGTALSGFVTQTNSTCANVNPGDSCTLTYTRGSTVVAQTNFPIQGDNTTVVIGAISMVSAPFVYITNQFNNTISQCTVSSSTGTLSSCFTTTSVSFHGPNDVALNNGYAYISNLSDGVTQCIVNPLTGVLTSCAATGSGSAFYQPEGVAFNNGFAYIVNHANNRVLKCKVDLSTGALSRCASTGSGFSAPYGIAINNGYAYIVNAVGNTVRQCSVNPETGVLFSCANTGSGLSKPVAVAVNNDYAYIANFNTKNVSKCKVDPVLGALSSCVITASGFSAPVLAVALNNGFAYIGSQNSIVSKCTVDPSTGALSNCAATGSEFNGPMGIGF